MRAFRRFILLFRDPIGTNPPPPDNFLADNAGNLLIDNSNDGLGG